VLQFRLFGGFNVRSDGTPLPQLQERLQIFLACLLLSPNGPISRRELAYRLWPDSTDSQARTNLRTLLTRLREALPESDRFLLLDALTIGICPDAPIELDVAVFESALQLARVAKQENRVGEAIEALKAAVAAYGGDLLPGCYDEWILPERERLRQAYLGALEQLIELFRTRGDYRAAIEQAQRLRRADPLHEPVYRELMRLNMAIGDRAGALRIYHACASILRDELGVDPAPETDTLHLELLRLEGAHLPAPIPAAAAQPELIGRDVPWALLTAAWRRAAQRGPQFALLSGEAGIGKTRLAEDLIAWIERQDQAVAVARCYAGQADVPYAPIVQWLAAPAIRQRLVQLETPWLVEVSRLATWLHVDRPDLPEPGPLTEAWQRQRLFEALALALSGPGAFLVDDLHWCDSDTLDWLRYWLHSSRNAPFLLIGTARAEEIGGGHPLADLWLSLAQAGLGSEIPLTRLDAQQTAAVGAILLGRELSAGEAEQLYRDAEGVPLFITEIARAGLVGESHITRPDTPSDLDDADALPPVIRAVIEFSLLRLSPEAREMAQTAAVIGREFSAAVLASAMGQSQDELLPALDELWQRRIIREQGADAYDFSHDKIRQVAYAGLSPARRRKLHGRVAAALVRVHERDLDAVSGQVGRHFEQAGELDRAIPMYRRAAKAAGHVYANDEAIGILEALLRADFSARLDPTEAIEIRLELAEIWRTVGRWAEAEKIAREALDRAERIGSAALKAKAQRVFADVKHLQGHYDDALEWLASAEQDYAALGDRPGVMSTLRTMGETYWLKGDNARSLKVLQRQLHLAEEVDDQRAMCEALYTMGFVYWSQGDWIPSRERCLKSLAIAEEIRHLGVASRAAITLGNVETSQKRMPEALHWYHTAWQAARQMDDRQVMTWAMANTSTVYSMYGDDLHAAFLQERANDLSASVEDWWTLCQGIGNIAEYSWRLDHRESAVSLLTRIIAASQTWLTPAYLANMLIQAGQWAVEELRWDDAWQFLCEVEAIAASVEGGRMAGQDGRLDLAILSIRTRLGRGDLTPKEAVGGLECLLDQYAAPEQQAQLHYQAWRIAPSAGTHGVQAAALYRGLYADHMAADFRQRFHELTGERLPEPRPLNKPSDWAPDAPFDLEAIIADAEALAARMEATINIG